MTKVGKPVTRKPSWLKGIILPVLAGILLGHVISSEISIWSWYIFSGWQFICGLAVIFERAPIYGATSVPQSQRVCELYGIQWLGMGFLTILAAHELQERTVPLFHALSDAVLLLNLACTFGFSVAAGPTRLVNANDNETILVPTNSFLVAVNMTLLVLSAR